MTTLKRRAAAGSVLGFAAFVGLASQHAVGSTGKHAARHRTNQAATAPATSFFDEHDEGFTFDDSGVQQSESQPAPASPSPSQATQAPQPPVAQTSVS